MAVAASVNSGEFKNTDNIKEEVKLLLFLITPKSIYSFNDSPIARMRRYTVQNSGHTGSVNNEFHLDVQPVPIWHNGPMSVQLLPTHVNGHHSGLEHLINTGGEQIDRE